MRVGGADNVHVAPLERAVRDGQLRRVTERQHVLCEGAFCRPTLFTHGEGECRGRCEEHSEKESSHGLLREIEGWIVQ